jgi:glycosyltransferase involved in cell wall biosynthesis
VVSESAGRPNVVRLITRLNVGGPARQALLLTHHLADDFPTTLGAGRPTASEGELLDERVPVRRLPLVRPLRPVVDARAVVAVRRLLRETDARILHTHMAKAGTVGRTAARTLSPRPRTVHTFHGHVLDGYFSAPVRSAFVEIERRLARVTDVLVAISDEIRDELLDLGIGRPSQYRVIPLGFDLAPFFAVEGGRGELRARLGLAPDVPLVGIIGRLVPIKDHVTAFQAMARLPGVHLAVVGDGELRADLEARVRRMHLDRRVHFTGWMTDVASVVSDVDVVVLTSRNEGTPVSLIEAAACGRAAVATDVGGVRAVVEDGVNGYLARPGDAEQLAAFLDRVLRDVEGRRRMGEAGRARVRDRFSQERLLRDVRDLYGELSERPSGSPAIRRNV